MHNNTDLPNKDVQELDNEVHHRIHVESAMSSPHHTKKPCITFAEGTQSTEVSSSQNTCFYKDALSQPSSDLSHLQKLLWLQKRRETGLWVQCDDCNRWRYLPHIVDSHELPKKWYCKMNSDKSAADCSVPEVPIKLREEEDLIHSEYSAGSVVWARLAGWPWWPAMTHYNVVFFDAFEVTRAWISPENLRPYSSNKNSLINITKNKRFKKRLDVALKQADDADMLPLANRLNKYSFINRYKGTICKPKKISKEYIKKFKKQITKQLNVDYVDESDTDSIESSDSELALSSPKGQTIKRKNVIIVGSSKRTKQSYSNVQEKSERDVTANDAPVAESNTGNNEAATEVNDNTELPDNNTNVYHKQPNSMTVQVSCTPAFDTMNIDNDSSKTYVPDSETGPASMDISQTQSVLQDIQVSVDSPSSDDFEF
ncbi:unnamed protein product [Diatraea saccharalis]|uniref:Zinc finger CW-type PWWP domain protein 1 n=1 Tax=Diatraea saccharalis TaxID=40085 RepID=A0A9N9QV14_9NEOP|nr:unnamed protein product [Diatraea saccharalis]